jgi:hypothetical protein
LEQTQITELTEQCRRNGKNYFAAMSCNRIPEKEEKMKCTPETKFGKTCIGSWPLTSN